MKYSKFVKYKEYSISISKEEFEKIMKTGNFDKIDNKPTQNLTYCLENVK